MSGYPPIPRDPSGAPLPVVWDDGLQSWKVYEGLMPLETKLAAIESKLLALDSKFADGSAKVALSGTNVEIVKIFDALAITTTSTISSNLISLNRYKTGTFVLYHTLNVELELYPQFGAALNSYIHVNGEWKSTQAAPITIPPTSSEGRMMLNTHPTYKDVFSSGLLSVRFAVRPKTAPTSGSLTLEYWGSIR